MTRTAREISEYGFYHVVQKGCGGQLIFEDEDDRLYLIRLIASKCQKFKVDVIAWCLMDNHIHLLLDDEHAHLSDCMHSITTAYAMYFNSKTGRKCPLFQDRFKSVPILDDDQLLNCVRYIHDNPAKARIDTASLYRWSSFSEYMGYPGICKTDCVLELLGNSQRFFAFSTSGEPNGYCFRYGAHVSDADALEFAQALLKPYEPHHLKALPKGVRDDCIRKLKSEGFSIKQIVRLTGIGHCTIQKVKVEK